MVHKLKSLELKSTLRLSIFKDAYPLFVILLAVLLAALALSLACFASW